MNKFITGPAGVGKTYMAKELLEESRKDYEEIKNKYGSLVPKDALYKFYSIPMMIAEAKVPKRALELINEANLAYCVVLDDLGVSKNSSYDPDIIYIIIDKRLEKGRPTIVTSNLSLDDIATNIDERLASRLASYKQIKLQGKDKRIS